MIRTLAGSTGASKSILAIRVQPPRYSSHLQSNPEVIDCAAFSLVADPSLVGKIVTHVLKVLCETFG